MSVPAAVGARAPAVSLSRLFGLQAPSRLERLLRALLAAAVIGLGAFTLLDFVLAPLTGRFTGDFEDFEGPLYAGRQASGGGDIYGQFIPLSHDHLVTNLGFDYLPLVAWLARPLAALPHAVAVTVWLWVLLACTIAGAVIVAREALPAGWPRVAIGFCGAMAFAPATYNLWHGQMNAVVFLFLALAFRSWMRGDELACGVWLGLGAAVKVAPIALLVLLVRRRWWRGIAAGSGVAAASVLAGGVLVSFGSVRAWFTQVLPVLGRDDGWYFNQSWNAVVNRLADHNVIAVEAPSPWIHPLVLSLSAAGLGLAAWCVLPAPASRDRRALEFSAGVTALVLVGTISWYAVYVHLLIPLLVIAGLAVRRRAAGGLLAAAAACLAVTGIAAPLFLGSQGKDWVVAAHGTALWWPALQLVSLPAAAATLLVVALLTTLLRSSPRRPRTSAMTRKAMASASVCSDGARLSAQ